ncbi:MAG: TolC family protein [Epsilonproteobacteria bacterium]|nr:TolC family protein [Campylobacterota bacterium]
MKKLAIFMAISLHATTIANLLEAIKNTPDYKLDNVAVKEMKINKESIKGMLYPSISLFASKEHFNRYNSLIPLPPTESAELMAKNESLPFSQNIDRIGFSASMPIFVKEIYDNKKKMEQLVKATKILAKINLLKKEALLVTYVSKLNYLFKLKKALLKQKDSIQTTYKALKVGVNVGRIPEFKLVRLQDSLNQIKIKISSINSNIAQVQSDIYKLTKIYIKHPINITSGDVKKGDFISIKPLKSNLQASMYDIKAKKSAFYPKLILKASGNRAYAKAYNTDENIQEDFASVGIYLNWEIFNKKNSADIQKAKIEMIKNKLQISKTIKDLNAQIMQINHSINETIKQIKLTQKSIKLKKELLKGAKVAFKLNRMSVDDYLQYENDLTQAYANIANLIATKNTLKANKALIYGENLERIFK